MTADTMGGVWTYALELADALLPFGVEVHLATMGLSLDAAQRHEVGESAIAAVHESSYALEWQEEPWEDLDRAGTWLLELESSVVPDIIHLNGYTHGCLPWRTPVVVVAHSDVLSWWQAVRQVPAPDSWERYRAAVEAGLRGADAVCTPTRAVLGDLQRHYSFSTQAYVVHNGRSAQAHVAAVKERFVLGIGRFDDEAKNVAALRHARSRSAWPVLLIGAGTSIGRLPSHEVALFLARAAIFASPVLYEPFGLAILEAALAGSALVLGDLPSLREVWGDAALFVPSKDDEAIAAALLLLQRNDDLRRELGERASRRAERYTPAAMAAGYVDVYRRVLPRQPMVVS